MSDRWLGRSKGKEIDEFSQSRDKFQKFHLRFSVISPCDSHGHVIDKFNLRT